MEGTVLVLVRAEDVIVQYAYEYPKDKKSKIVIELIGKCTETHNIIYGIVAYSFMSRYPLSVSRFQYHYSLLYVSRSEALEY